MPSRQIIRKNSPFTPTNTLIAAGFRTSGAAPNRRMLLRGAVGTAASAALFVRSGDVKAQISSNDIAYLRFAVQIKFLLAQFFSYALFNVGVEAGRLAAAGDTAPGAVTGGRKLEIADAQIRSPMVEIYGAHQENILLLRDLLFQSMVSQPAIAIDGGDSGPFTLLARAGGLAGAGESFDPYASVDNLLLAMMALQDLGVAALHHIVSRLENPLYRERIAALAGMEAYHAATVRHLFYVRNATDAAQLRRSEQMAAALRAFDGSTGIDRGVTPTTVDGALVANIAVVDADGLAVARTPERTLNILFANRGAATSGGFFPAGLKGSIRKSAN